ncbi:hypothetical protein [Pseudoalteromonas sp.]|nr:hypothetical protein [Pseudoalteromonas sp.]
MTNIPLPIDADEEAMMAFYRRLIKTVNELEARIKELEDAS